MKDPNEISPSRRQFLATGARYLAAAGLGCLVGVQELKRRRLEGDPNCVKLYTCGQCVEFHGCSKPKALEFRIASGRSGKAAA